MQEFISNSYNETIEFAKKFAKKLSKGSIIAFIGDLGMGKTAFTVGLAQGLDIKEQVSSPTFAICNTYIGEKNTLYHYDMYRIETWDDLYSTGFFDALDTNSFIAIEWSENVYEALPNDSYVIEFEKLSDNSRKLKIFKKYENLL